MKKNVSLIIIYLLVCVQLHAQLIKGNPSLTPIVVESRCHCTFKVLAMNSVSYKFLFF